MPLELLGTSGCHLCDAARTIVTEALEQRSGHLAIHEIDIAQNSVLLNDFGTRIPVLRYRDRILFWPFDVTRVLEILD